MLSTALSEAAELCSATPSGGPVPSLPDETIRAVVHELLDPVISDDDKAKFLRALTTKGETAIELREFAAALLPYAIEPGFISSFDGKPLLDCCGTGGSGLDLVNISTGMMFLLAACGVPVAKHGNVGVTKKSGSADVLRALGIRIDLPAELQKPCLETVGATFLFARQYHPAFKAIAPVRQKLAMEGRRTIFNLLGPLLNPARPAVQLTGVVNHEHLPLFADALGSTCSRRLAVFGANSVGVPFGEVSVSGENRFAGDIPEGIADWIEDQEEAVEVPSPLAAMAEIEAETEAGETPALSPENIARYAELTALHVTSPEHSAATLTSILSLDPKASSLARKLLLINTSVALVLHTTAPDLATALQQATEALDSGKALARLKLMQAFSEKYSA
ncbi:MAG: anthranilate phosphoribosyltransferase [Candidatus Methylacidiphilales bacterium]